MTAFHRKVQANAEFACSPALLYEILTDYDSYKDWMPKVRASALLARAGELAIARLDLVPPGEEYASLECIHTLNRSVLSRAIEGQLELRSLDWDLEHLANGHCRVTLVLEGQTKLPVGTGSRDLLNADAMLAALKGYAGAFMPELVFDGVKGDVTLEIFETENGLTCWFNGQEYEMKPVRKFIK
jgi:ribosome-associated toxin RatA of RatAB toxin-antitoxin module